jgi:hypothetical protein
MTTINRLNSVDTLQDGDQIAVYDKSNGDARKASMSTVAEYIRRDTDDATEITFTQEGVGAVERTVADKLYESVSVKDFGATGDGITDDSVAIQAAINAVGLYGSITFPRGVYLCKEINLTCDMDMDVGALLLYSGTTWGALINVNRANIKVGHLYASGNNQECTCLNIGPLGYNGFYETVKIQNVKALAGQGNIFNAAIRLEGNSNLFVSVSFYDLVNDGVPNGSYPQAFTTIGTATDNKVEAITARNCHTVLCHASTGGDLFVDSIYSVESYDNGIYQTGIDSRLAVGALYYKSGVSEEAAVLQKGSAHIGQITLQGRGTAVGLDYPTDVYIGEIVSIPDSANYTNTWFIRTRSSSSAENPIGRVHIGRLSGTINGAGPWYFGDAYDGYVEYLIIDNVDVTFNYSAATCPNPGDFCSMDNVKGFTIRDCNIRIVDINDEITTPTTYFTMQAPISSVIETTSYLDNFNVVCTTSDGKTINPNINFRGQYFAQEEIYVWDTTWQTNVGPYIRETSFSSGVKDSVSSTPTTGYWKEGTDFVLRNATSAPFRTRCTVSGTPGTWVEY